MNEYRKVYYVMSLQKQSIRHHNYDLRISKKKKKKKNIKSLLSNELVLWQLFSFVCVCGQYHEWWFIVQRCNRYFI